MSYEDLDVFGRIVVKVKLDDEIRKAAIHNKELTFNELGLMIQRIFSDLINKTDEFIIKYMDEDGDLITILNDSDILLAIETNKTLRITLMLKKNEKDKPQAKEIDSDEVVKELQSIHTSLDRFLNRFADIMIKPAKTESLSNEPKKTDATKVPAMNQVTPSIEKHIEFDPLATKKPSRSETPDSTSNINLQSISPNQRKQPQSIIQNSDPTSSQFYKPQSASMPINSVLQDNFQSQLMEQHKQSLQTPSNPIMPTQIAQPNQQQVPAQLQYPNVYQNFGTTSLSPSNMPVQPQYNQNPVALPQQTQYAGSMPQGAVNIQQQPTSPQMDMQQQQQNFMQQQYMQQMQAYQQQTSSNNPNVNNPYAKSSGTTMNRYPPTTYPQSH